MALKDYYNTGDTSAIVAFSNAWKAQTFTAGSDYDIASIKLYCYRGVGTSAATVTVSIRSTTAGVPDGAVGELCSSTTNWQDLPTSATWTTFTFSSAASLTSTNVYAIIFTTSSTTYGMGARADYNGSGPDPYSGGAVYYATTGETWTISHSPPAYFDALFETYTAPAYIDATGSIVNTLGVAGTVEVATYVDVTGSVVMVLALSGTLEEVLIKTATGLIAISMTLAGVLTTGHYLTWITHRPAAYDPDAIYDEDTKSWTTVDGRGGSRYQSQMVVVGQDDTGDGIIYFGAT